MAQLSDFSDLDGVLSKDIGISLMEHKDDILEMVNANYEIFAGEEKALVPSSSILLSAFSL